MRSHLADVNVWVALAYDAHPQHFVARHWFETVEDGSALFCRVTQLGFLRLLTNRSFMSLDVLNQRQAWKTYDRLRADGRTGFITEAEEVEPLMRSLTNRRTPSPKMWNDAYLAAFARTHGASLVTFDSGFSALSPDAVILPSGVH